jgi:hypothetical protein
MRFILAMAAFLFSVAGFSAAANSFESGDIAMVGTYCETEAEVSKLFNDKASLCYTVLPRFPCTVIENLGVSVRHDRTVASCRPHPDAIDFYELPPVVYSFYKTKGIGI